MQPGLVVKRVVADLMPGRRDPLQRLVIFVQGRVLTDDEHGDVQIPLSQEIKEPRHHDVQVRRERIPPGIAVGFHVGPLVVQVEREAGDLFHGRVDG